MNPESATSVTVVKICIVCSATLEDIQSHRQCVLTGLEQNLFKSKAEWLALCKPRKMIRRVLV